jgi:hypothetical protein
VVLFVAKYSGFAAGKTSLALPCHKIVLDCGERWEQFPGAIGGVWKGAMDQRVFIAQLNIEHYREKLLSEKDGATRRQIARLLAEEEAKLVALSDPPGNNKEKDKP